MLKNLLDACGGAIAFYALGFGLAFGSTTHTDKSTFVGNTNFFLSGDVNSALFFFQLAIASTAVTIVAGTLAERCKMIAYLFYSTVLTGLVYPVVVHAICKLWGNDMYRITFFKRVHLTRGLHAIFSRE